MKTSGNQGYKKKGLLLKKRVQSLMFKEKVWNN